MAGSETLASPAHASASYYAAVAAAFNCAAADYDRLHTTNPVMAWLRQQSLALLKATFPSNSRLLELGCGTGEEARNLAAAGRRVLATDISPVMIDVAGGGDPRGLVEFRTLGAHEVNLLRGEFGDQCFDGAYSSFGALNCEPRTSEVAEGLRYLIKPGGHVVVSVMNRTCLWEMAWFLGHGQFAQAGRRLHGDWMNATVTGTHTVAARYYTPRSFTAAFAPYFRVQRVMVLGLLVPPPYLSGLAHRFPRAFAAAQRAETYVREWPGVPWLGDHFVMVLRRRDG